MRSLTSRLVVATVALVAVVALAIGAATTLAMSDYLTDRLDRDVRAAAQRIFGGPGPASLPPGAASDESVPGQGFGTVTVLIRSDTSVALRSTVLTETDAGPEEQPLSDEATALLTAIPVDGKVHAVTLPGLGDYRVTAEDFDGRVRAAGIPVVVVAGLPDSSVDEVISSLIWWEILLSLLGIAAAAGGALVVVRRQLAPLREVAETAHQVAGLPLSSGEVDLSPRVHDPDERTEVGQVGAALNTLLAHVEESLEARHRSEQQVRQFVADASHELRTPLSTIRGYAELARRTPDDASALGGSLSKVSGEADRMTALVDDLLLLARLDAGRPLAREPVDLTHLLLEAVQDARVLGPGDSTCPRSRSRWPATNSDSTRSRRTCSPTPAATPPTARPSPCVAHARATPPSSRWSTTGPVSPQDFASTPSSGSAAVTPPAPARTTAVPTAGSGSGSRSSTPSPAPTAARCASAADPVKPR